MGDANFESFLTVFSKNEHESYDGSDKTSNVGEIVVYGVELSFIDSVFRGFIESDLGKILIGAWDVADVIEFGGQVDDFIWIDVTNEGPDAFLCVDGIFLEEDSGTCSIVTGKTKDVEIIEVKTFVFFIIRIDLCVDNRYSKYELIDWTLESLEDGIVDTGWIDCWVASSDLDSEVDKFVWGESSFDFELVA